MALKKCSLFKGLKSQSSFEFVSILSMFMVIILGSISAVQVKTFEVVQEKNNVLAQSISNLIETEVTLALSVDADYYRDFSLPPHVESINYSVSRPSLTEAVIYINDAKHVVFLNSEVAGSFKKGDNYIKKVNNGLFVNDCCFYDVLQGSTYYDSVNYVISQGFMTRNKDGYFGANENLTRAQAAVALAKMHRWTLSLPTAGNTFSDVTASHPYFLQIEALHRFLSQRGVSVNCAQSVEHKFCPDDNISRRDLAIFMGGTSPLGAQPQPTIPFYVDVPMSNPGFSFIQYLTSKGVVRNCMYSQSHFCPDQKVTRAQAAEEFELYHTIILSSGGPIATYGCGPTPPGTSTCSVPQEGYTWLYWQSSGATQCLVDGHDRGLSSGGYGSGTITSTTTSTLTCTGPGGSTSKSITIFVQ